MKVVFRVDASVWIGSGHVMRCLVLADELAKNGHDVSFACLPLEGDMRAFIGERGFDVITLAAPDQAARPAHDADYASWLPKRIPDDAHDFIGRVRDADVVVTDHYAIERQWHEIIRARLSCNIVAIDDLVRTHGADIVIDQTLGRRPEEYGNSGSLVLTGTDYALLASNFRLARDKVADKVLNSRQARVLVSMGGVDLPNATLSVLKTFEQACLDIHITVLMSERSPHYTQLSEWCRTRDNVQHYDFIEDMASLMIDHDVSVGAPGSTSWERACVGLPSIIIPLADNQVEICKRLVMWKVAEKVNLGDITTKLIPAYHNICTDWKELHLRSLALCDGLGTTRVVSNIIGLNDACNNYL